MCWGAGRRPLPQEGRVQFQLPFPLGSSLPLSCGVGLVFSGSSWPWAKAMCALPSETGPGIPRVPPPCWLWLNANLRRAPGPLSHLALTPEPQRSRLHWLGPHPSHGGPFPGPAALLWTVDHRERREIPSRLDHPGRACCPPRAMGPLGTAPNQDHLPPGVLSRPALHHLG